MIPVKTVAAAGLVVFFVWFAHSVELNGEQMLIPASLVTLGAGLLMVSSVRYNSFKKVDLAGRMRFLPFAAVVGMLTLVMVNPPMILFVMFLGYALSGPILMLWKRVRPGT